ncbi:MAG: hypothetical protein GY853_15075 [PVC group bacterium]|nr:hypothetical protein [Desulfobacteraceae bacterium]MCP4060532.1 hypothetical protein [Pseudoalteromonas sp.]MCP4651386.1 hypothetical protein [PVC group bacterium]
MSVNKLLWLGCGDCEGLKYFHSQFDEMLLIDSRHIDELAIPENIKGSFQQLVVSTKESLSIFKETNIPELSSLNIVGCFLSNFPGLKVENEREVYTKNVFDIVHDFFTGADKKTLILDIPDSQFKLLSVLADEDALNNIDEIIVWSVPQDSEGQETDDSIRLYLENNGFVSFTRGENFSGYNWVHFIPNPLFFKLKVLREKSIELEDKLKEENKKNKGLQEKYELLKQTGIRLESQIELIQKLMSFDS